MPEYIVRDFPHYTVSVLLASIRQRDRENLVECSHAVLRSAYNHLFIADYTDPDEATGLAMSQLILVMGDHRRA
jgi:hypothetical protein